MIFFNQIMLFFSILLMGENKYNLNFTIGTENRNFPCKQST